MEGNKKIVEAAKKLILNCMGTKPEEKLLIACNTNCLYFHNT